jgi:hypothetical protein
VYVPVFQAYTEDVALPAASVYVVIFVERIAAPVPEIVKVIGIHA